MGLSWVLRAGEESKHVVAGPSLDHDDGMGPSRRFRTRCHHVCGQRRHSRRDWTSHSPATGAIPIAVDGLPVGTLALSAVPTVVAGIIISVIIDAAVMVVGRGYALSRSSPCR